MKKNCIVFLVVLILIDQIIKWWMIAFHPFFVFENKGVIFGFIENQVIGYGLLAIGFGILVWLICKTDLSSIIYHLSISLIIAGAVSNLLDRIFRGNVIDYFNFFNLNHFNLADIYIILGVVLYGYALIISKK